LARKLEKGWVRKRKEVEHPVAAADIEGSSDDENTSSDEDIRSTIDQLEEVLRALPVREEEGKATTVRVQGAVNGMPAELLIDTGASKSLISNEKAQAFGIEVTNITRKFKGVGREVGYECKPALVNIGRRQLDVTFYMLNDPVLPTLLGTPELAKLDILIDPRRNQLLDFNDRELVAACEEDPEFDGGNREKHDLITQKTKGTTDEELAWEGQAVLKAKMGHLDEKSQREVMGIFLRYKETWLRPKVGGATKAVAQFVVEGRPVKEKLRMLTPELKEELETQLDAMLRAHVIQPSKSPWGSVPVFTKKKDGGWRLCLDYRKVNMQIKSDGYPVPLLWDQIIQAAHHRWYICLDLNWGFWNIPLHPDSREVTALVTHKGTYEFLVLPFGMKNSPAEFQRMMDRILGDIYNKGIICYIDDIVIYSNSQSVCLELLDEVMQRIREAGLFIKLAKAEVLQDQVKILGHVVGVDGILPDPKKVEAIHNARPPKSKAEVRSFLGTVSYLRRFVPNFSSMTTTINGLLKKGATFHWSEGCQKDFIALKESLVDQVLLCAPQGRGLFVIVADACDYGVGAAILQEQDKEIVILEFASKSLSTTQKKWPTREKEAYAIRWAVEKFEDYVKTGSILILTDNQSLQWMATAASGKVQRWAIYLQQFDIEIRHISGSTNNIADWLSRSVPDEDTKDEDEEILIPTFNAVDEDATEKPILRQVGIIPYVPNIEDLEQGYKTTTEEEMKQTFLAPDGLRYSVKANKLFIPKTCRELFIHWFHGSRWGGHIGVGKTIRRLKGWVWWQGMAKDVQEYVKQCLICIRHSAPPRAITTMGILSRPLPLQLISLDFVGPRMWWAKSYYFLVVIDHATRYIMAKATDNPPTTKWTIEAMKRQWCSVFYAPTAILVDRGSQFRATEFRTFVTEELMATLIYTSPYYPQGNAINEASHKALDASLSAFNETMDSTFEDALQDAITVHNSTPHSATGYSPNYGMFGMELALPGWQKYRREAKDSTMRFVGLREERRKLACRKILEEENLACVAPRNIQVGQWVVFWLSLTEKQTLSEAGNNKYSARWSLPAQVAEVKKGTITVQCWGGGGQRQVPIAQVKVLQGAVPSTLQDLNVKLLTKFVPRTIRHWSLKPGGSGSSEWSEVINKSAKVPRTAEPEERTLRTGKRRRGGVPNPMEPAASQEED
jgi:transposase InsO family protein